MKLAKQLLEYLKHSSEYKYTGWNTNDLSMTTINLDRIEWCYIIIKNLYIIIRRDDNSPYYCSIAFKDFDKILGVDELGKPNHLLIGSLDDCGDTNELINFLKNTPKKS